MVRRRAAIGSITCPPCLRVIFFWIMAWIPDLASVSTRLPVKSGDLQRKRQRQGGQCNDRFSVFKYSIDVLPKLIMKVAIRQLCSYGAMHPERDIMSWPEIVGTLQLFSFSFSSKGWDRRCVSLRPLDSQVAADLVPRLRDWPSVDLGRDLGGASPLLGCLACGLQPAWMADLLGMVGRHICGGPHWCGNQHSHGPWAFYGPMAEVVSLNRIGDRIVADK